MTAPGPGPRTCPQCGGSNYGDLPRCILCGARMNAPEPAVAFCGECGAQLEPGLRFCGECGTPVAARKRALSESESRWAPPAPDKLETRPPRPSTAEPPKLAGAPKKFCRGCGTQLQPAARFCRKCGRDVDARAVKPSRPKAPPAAKQRPAPALPAATPQKALPAGPGLVKKGLRIVVPVGSMAATYFLTNKIFGPMLIQQFGDAGRQMVPLLVSMAVGGVARQITK